MASSSDRRLSIGQYLCVAGPIAVLLYLIHVVWGGLAWPGYNPMTQTISELTGSTSPNATALTVLTTTYGVGMVICAIGVVLTMPQLTAPTTTRVGAILLLVMTAASLIGYGLFPLDLSGAVDSFQNLGHYVVTGIVVLCTLGSVWLVGIGLSRTSAHRRLGLFSVVCASIITIFGGITPAAIAQGWPISGLTERINIFTLLAWVCVLAVYLYRRTGTLVGAEHQPAV
jgi:hypothetical membrane protein